MSPDRWTRTVALTVCAFGFLINIVQFLDLKKPMRFAVGFGTVACVAVAASFFFRARKYENALRFKLPTKLSSLDGYHLEYVATEAAFAEISRASETIYGEDNVALERSLSWWRQFPRGVFVAYWQPNGGPSEIAGYVSMWPVKKSTYAKLKLGHMRECEISHRSIEGVRATHARKFWYVSNIVVARARRRILRELLEQAIHNWIESGDLDKEVCALAFVYSKEGEDLLRRFGFRARSEKSADGWPVFELEAATNTLGSSLTSALAKRRWRSNSGLQQTRSSHSLGPHT